MTLKRAMRKWIALLGVSAILFAQIAVAAYACPAFASSQVNEQASAMDMSNSDAPCAEMDVKQANLCIEHCQYGQQSLDHPVAPAVFAVADLPYFLVRPADPAVLGSTQEYAPSLLTRTTAPPLSVRNCCFRI
jgi:hypothetical protein